MLKSQVLTFKFQVNYVKSLLRSSKLKAKFEENLMVCPKYSGHETFIFSFNSDEKCLSLLTC